MSETELSGFAGVSPSHISHCTLSQVIQKEISEMSETVCSQASEIAL